MLQLNTVILTDMKKELEKLQPDISNIIYRGLAKFVPDHKINLVDDVATNLVDYIIERLVKNNFDLDDVIIPTKDKYDKFIEDSWIILPNGERKKLNEL